LNTENIDPFKIGFDAKRLFLNKSGLGNYSRWLINGLANQFPENEYHLYTTNTSEFQKDFSGDNIHTHLPPNLFKTFWRSKGVKRDLLHDKIKVYHGLSNELPYGIEKIGIKSIVTIHDLIFKVFPDYYNSIDRAIYDIKFRNACERADKIVAISNHTKECIINYYNIHPDKIEVIYLDASEKFNFPSTFLKIEQVKEKFGIQKPFFLNVGAIGGRKNQLRLVKAFASIANKIEQNLLLIGKPGKDLEEINLIISKYKLADRIYHFSEVNDEDLFNIYQASYATVYPSIYEGFGIPLIESYRSGKPILTSMGSSLEEIAGKSGLICNPIDCDDISKKLLELTDSITYKKLFDNIPNSLFHFKSELLIKKYMNLYNEIKS